MKIFVVTYHWFKIIVIGYETPEDALMICSRHYTTDPDDVPQVREITERTLIFQDLK